MGISEIAQTFGVDWPHLLAQMVSFSLVCALLYRLAYQPVLKMLETRRQQIAQGLADAGAAHARLAEIEKERVAMIALAQAEAARIVAGARETAKHIAEQESSRAAVRGEQIVKRAQDAADLERTRLLSEVKGQAARLIARATAVVTGKVLTDADQRRLAGEALKRMA
jgi:F-type H+-transporting ATPase subunit b